MTGLIESRINTLEARARAMRHQAKRAFEVFNLVIDKYYEYLVWTASDMMEWVPVSLPNGIEAIPYLEARKIVCTEAERTNLFKRCFPAVFGCVATYNVPSASSVAKTGGGKHTKDRSFPVIFLGRMPVGKRMYAGVDRQGKVWEGINFEFAAADQIGKLMILPTAQQDSYRDFTLTPEPPPTKPETPPAASQAAPASKGPRSKVLFDDVQSESESEDEYFDAPSEPIGGGAQTTTSEPIDGGAQSISNGSTDGLGVPPIRRHGTRSTTVTSRSGSSKAVVLDKQQLCSEASGDPVPSGAAQPSTHGHGTRSRTRAEGQQPTGKSAQCKEVGSVTVGPAAQCAQHKEVGSVTVKSASQGVQLEGRMHVCLQGGGDVDPLTGQVNLREALQPIFASIVHDDFDATTNERCRANWALLGTCVGDLSLSLLHEASPLLAAAVADAVDLDAFDNKDQSGVTGEEEHGAHSSWKSTEGPSLDGLSVRSNIIAPKSVGEALRDPIYAKMWQHAIDIEVGQKERMQTYTEVKFKDYKGKVRMHSLKCLFSVKYNGDGSVSRFKCRLYYAGFWDKPGVDYEHSWSAMPRCATGKLLDAIACTLKLRIYQTDVVCCFNQSRRIQRLVIGRLPSEMRAYDEGGDEIVWRALVCSYGLPEATREWAETFDQWILVDLQSASPEETARRKRLGLPQRRFIFNKSQIEESMYVLKDGGQLWSFFPQQDCG